MRRMLVLLLVLLLATGAAAQIIPVPDVIGIYFDTEAIGYDTFFIGNTVGYVIITDMTHEAVYAWEAAMHVNLTSDFAGFVNHVEVPEGIDGLQIGTAPNIIMAYAAPIPAGPVVVIGEFAFGWYGTGIAELTLGPNETNPSIPGSLAVQIGPTAADIVAFGYAELCSGMALIGMDCPLATETASFGAVKALYR